MRHPGVCNSHDEQALAVIADSVARFVTVGAIGSHDVLSGDARYFDTSTAQLILKVDDVVKECLSLGSGVAVPDSHYFKSPKMELSRQNLPVPCRDIPAPHHLWAFPLPHGSSCFFFLGFLFGRQAQAQTAHNLVILIGHSRVNVHQNLGAFRISV